MLNRSTDRAAWTPPPPFVASCSVCHGAQPAKTLIRFLVRISSIEDFAQAMRTLCPHHLDQLGDELGVPEFGVKR